MSAKKRNAPGSKNLARSKKQKYIEVPYRGMPHAATPPITRQPALCSATRPGASLCPAQTLPLPSGKRSACSTRYMCVYAAHAINTYTLHTVLRKALWGRRRQQPRPFQHLEQHRRPAAAGSGRLERCVQTGLSTNSHEHARPCLYRHDAGCRCGWNSVWRRAVHRGFGTVPHATVVNVVEAILREAAATKTLKSRYVANTSHSICTHYP